MPLSDTGRVVAAMVSMYSVSLCLWCLCGGEPCAPVLHLVGCEFAEIRGLVCPSFPRTLAGLCGKNGKIQNSQLNRVHFKVRTQKELHGSW